MPLCIALALWIPLIVQSASASAKRASGGTSRFCCSPGAEHSQHSVSFDSQYTSHRSQYIGGSQRGSISHCCVRHVCRLGIRCGGRCIGIWRSPVLTGLTTFVLVSDGFFVLVWLWRESFVVPLRSQTVVCWAYHTSL